MIYFLRKHGYYYGHNSAGYTSCPELAEIYSGKKAKSHVDSCEDVHAIPVIDVLTLDRVEAVISKLIAVRAFLQIEKNNKEPETQTSSPCDEKEK